MPRGRPKKQHTELVQIQPNPIPPWHQSTETLTSCPLFYVTSVIKGKKQPGGMESARGKEVHKTGSDYASWCAHKGVSMDLDAFDRLAAGAGPVAAKILSGMRESYQVDYQHLFATELRMSLDENMEPTEVEDTLGGVSVDTHLPACYQGTLDTLYLFREDLSALIDDLKTHSRPYNPDETLQAKMYTIFVMKHFPWVLSVKFRLVFVRYKNLAREVNYTREDLPHLIEAVKAARARQLMIHAEFEAAKDIEAISGSQCIYCPLLSNRGCPISEFNPNMQLSVEDRLRFNLWYSAFSKVNNKALRDYVNGTGKKVVLKDYNGKAYVFGPVESETNVYPLFKGTKGGIETDREGNPVMPIVSLIMDYAHATPDDTEWMGKLVISSTKLNSALGTKKRAMLDQACQDQADKVTKAPMKVSKPLEVDDAEEVEEENEEWGEDTDF